MGYLVLEGGAEFTGAMKAPDLRALDLAGGLNAKVGVICAAAVPDNNHEHAAKNAVRWFSELGAQNVRVMPLVDRFSADDASVTEKLESLNFIYLLGGAANYLANCLHGSSAMDAIAKVLAAGGVLCGSSAGAMVLGPNYFDAAQGCLNNGLGFLDNVCIVPHHDTFGRLWLKPLKKLLPWTVLIGIDEQTGLINDAGKGRWTVYGQGQVTLYWGENQSSFNEHQAIYIA
ncbi:MAG: type 1 glutamine amidotransferase-like domain-containing protein [Desulfobacteraceae bacterium]|nr:type 1 glutamine amidotransferase-like domain-containing protein [Desulfobacteraceae bacterium]